jgi:hypothetical protein
MHFKWCGHSVVGNFNRDAKVHPSLLQRRRMLLVGKWTFGYILELNFPSRIC